MPVSIRTAFTALTLVVVGFTATASPAGAHSAAARSTSFAARAGCDMTVAVDFTGSPAEAEIHVVQQSGTIEPPYIWNVDSDQVTQLPGLPEGTWYVKVYEGFTPGSSITVGKTVTVTNIVHAVGPCDTVDISIDSDLVLAPSVPVKRDPFIQMTAIRRTAMF